MTLRAPEQAVTGNKLTTRHPTLRVQLVSVAVGLASFLATEFMHYLLVPDIGIDGSGYWQKASRPSWLRH